MDFDTLFMNEAYLYAFKSKDIRTQVGANIVKRHNYNIGDKLHTKSISIMKGYNGPLSGVDDTKQGLFEKPYKDFAMEHAERNAIYNCARIGQSCDDCTMYVTCYPCADCARAIVQSGIKKIIVHDQLKIPHLSESSNYAREFFDECGVMVEVWSGQLFFNHNLRFCGHVYDWDCYYNKWVKV